MSDQDICANCGKVYEKHSEQTYCGPGESKWFPKKLADATMKAEKMSDKPVEIAEDLKLWYSVACDKVHFATDYDAIKKLIERLSAAEAKVKELEQWREKYFQIERAHSNAIDKIGELTARVMLRERELAERSSDKSRLEEKIKGMRNAYDRTSQEAHDSGLKALELQQENASLREQYQLVFEAGKNRYEEVLTLRSQVERLKAPISDAEMQTLSVCPWSELNAFLAARAKE
jgi:DNA repair exonuclease SbcCD ATPase subunit